MRWLEGVVIGLNMVRDGHDGWMGSSLLPPAMVAMGVAVGRDTAEEMRQAVERNIASGGRPGKN